MAPKTNGELLTTLPILEVERAEVQQKLRNGPRHKCLRIPMKPQGQCQFALRR